jgi:protein disulfide-isomerase-like protein
MILIVACFWIAASQNPQFNILELDDGTIANAIKTHDHLLIEFYSPWCRHCNRFAPEYNEAGQMLSERGYNNVLAKIDGTANPVSFSRYGIKEYPTLIYFFKGNKVEKYTGGRTKNDIYAYIVRNNF